MSEQRKTAVRELTEAEMKAIKGGGGTAGTTVPSAVQTFATTDVVLGLRKFAGGTTAGGI